MISGKFVADFDDFNNAVKGAETKLVSFETGASKVSGALERMEHSLSGKKLIQDATLAVQAVENIGGVSKLTEKQLQQLAGQATEAAAKMRAMGIDVPPGLQKIADEAKGADTAHGSLLGTVKSLALGFAAMFTVRAAFNFVKDTFEEASALKDLGQQTHINVEELQLLAGGMSEFGVEADELGKGLFKLSRGIAGGDESVTHALHLMGLSLKDVDGLQGKELFLKIMSGLATLQGGLRDTAAAELFGGKLGAAMAGASEGIEGTLDAWQRLNTFASTEAVDAMDTFGESIARAEKNLSSIAANMMGPLAEGFNTLVDVTQKGASKYEVFAAMTQDLIEAKLGLGTGTEHLTRLIDSYNQKQIAATASTVAATAGQKAAAVAIDQRTQAEKFLAALEADAAVALTATQRHHLEQLKEMGALNAANAAGVGVSSAQYQKYTADVTAATKALNDEKAATKDLYAFKSDLHRKTEAETAKQMAMHLELAAFTNANVLAELAAQEQLNAAHGLDAQGRLKVVSAAETLRIGLEALHLTKSEGISQAAQEQVLMNAYTAALQAEAVAQDQANGGLAKVPALAAAASSAIKGLTEDYWAQVDAAAAALAAVTNQPYISVGTRAPRLEDAGFKSRNVHGLSGVSDGGFHPLRGMGGPVSAGRSYIVGDGGGPELYTPGANGFITPTGGGSAPVQVNVSGILDPATIRQLTDAISEEQMRRSGRKFPSA